MIRVVFVILASLILFFALIAAFLAIYFSIYIVGDLVNGNPVMGDVYNLFSLGPSTVVLVIQFIIGFLFSVAILKNSLITAKKLSMFLIISLVLLPLVALVSASMNSVTGHETFMAIVAAFFIVLPLGLSIISLVLINRELKTSSDS